jgi:hypothetical protein
MQQSGLRVKNMSDLTSAYLMCATDKVHVVFLQESRYDIGSKGEGDATVVLGPPGNVLVGV